MTYRQVITAIGGRVLLFWTPPRLKLRALARRYRDALADASHVAEESLSAIRSTVRLVRDIPELIYVHEVGGKYAEANGHVILAALRKQDRWRRAKANRAKRKQTSSEHFRDLAQEHRGLIVNAAEELGL